LAFITARRRPVCVRELVRRVLDERQSDAKQNKRMPGQLSDALIFYPTGELVKEVVPDHVPYAVKYGLWDRGGFRGMKPLLDQYWRPYLRGSGTFEDAAAKLVEAQ
jgi:hypothetical protein